jgi:ribosomal protein S3
MEDTTKVKEAIRQFFDGFYVEGLVDNDPQIKDTTTRDMGIHFVGVEIKDGMINIDIHLERPGLLIGKHGSTIKLLQEHLIKVFSKAVHINIKETDIWK